MSIKNNKNNLKKMLLALELMDKQQAFIEEHDLVNLSEAEYSNYISENKKQFPRDKHGFIDWVKLEDNGEV